MTKLHSELCGLSKSYGPGYIFYRMIWFLSFIWSISHLCSQCVSLVFTSFCSFFRRTNIDIWPYFMFLAGNLILDDIAAENTEKFPDIKMQTCLKRSKCKTVRFEKLCAWVLNLHYNPLALAQPQCSCHAVLHWYHMCFLCLCSCSWAGTESSSSKRRIYSSQNVLSCNIALNMLYFSACLSSSWQCWLCFQGIHSLASIGWTIASLIARTTAKIFGTKICSLIKTSQSEWNNMRLFTFIFIHWTCTVLK